ncbi:MAG: hypothetical protein JWO71_666 [Candidatus Acidoferrum typicum]|nr:hypothetical protein [Candidatus Acidoferrum typicum]
MWRKFFPIVIGLLLYGSSPRLFAQERVEAGIFLDYLSISQTNTNNFGVGGRFGYRIHRKVMIEGELAYDYRINFHEAYRNIANGDINAIERTSIGVTHGLFGPTLQPAKGRFRPFVTLKGGLNRPRQHSRKSNRTKTSRAAAWDKGGHSSTGDGWPSRFPHQDDEN